MAGFIDCATDPSEAIASLPPTSENADLRGFTSSPELKKQISDLLRCQTDEVITSSSTQEETPGAQFFGYFEKKEKPDTTSSWFTLHHSVHIPAVDAGIEEMKHLITMLKATVAEAGFDLSSAFCDKVVMVIVAVCNALRSGTKDKVLTVGILTQALLGLGFGLTKHLTRFVMGVAGIFASFSQKELKVDLPEAQGEGDSSFAGIISEAFSGLADFISTDLLKSGLSTITAPASALIKWSKAIGAVKTIGQGLEYISKFIWSVFSWVYLKWTGKPLMFDENRILVERAVTWLNTYHELLKAHIEKEMNNSAEMCGRVLEHEKEGQEIEKQLMEVGYTKNNFTPFFKALVNMQTISADARIFLSTAKSRVQPLVIEYCGKPGVGKSLLVTITAHDLYAFYARFAYGGHSKTDLVKNRLNVLFDRKMDNVFWDGYFSQFAVSMDDFLQLDDKELRAKIATEIIYLANCNAMPLHMAKMELKASTYFTSKILILTSNSIRTPNLAIQDQNAFRRRRDFLVEVDYADGYWQGDPNAKEIKLPEGVLFTREAYKFRLYDKITEVPISGWINYEQLYLLQVEKFVEKYKNKASLETWLDENPMKLSGKDYPPIYIEKPKATLVEHFEKPKIRFGRNSQLNKAVEVQLEEIAVAQGKQMLYAQGKKDGIDLIIDEDEEEQAQIEESVSIARQAIENRRLLAMNPKELREEMLNRKMEAIRRDAVGLQFPEATRAESMEFLDELKEQRKEEKRLDEVKAYATAFKLDEKFLESGELLTKSIRESEKQMSEAIASTATWKVEEEKSFLELIKAHPILSTIMGLLTAAGTLFGIYKFVKWMGSDEPISGQAMSAPSKEVSAGISRTGPISTTWKRKGPVNFARKFKPPVAQNEATIQTFYNKAIAANMGKFTIVNPDGGAFSCGFLFLQDTTFVTAKHMMLYAKEGAQFELIFNTKRPDVVLKGNTVSMFCDPEDDFIFITVTNSSVQKFKSILHLFLTDKEFADADISKSIVYVRRGRHETPEFLNAVNTERLGVAEYKAGPSSSEMIESAHTIQYSAMCRSGICASPVGVLNDQVENKLMGIHVAGTRDMGIAGVMTFEYLQSVMDYIRSMEPEPYVAQGMVEEVLIDNFVDPNYEYGKLEFVGKVQPSHGHRLPGKSQIETSIAYGVFSQPFTAPAMLKPKDGISPLENVFTRWQKKPTEPPHQETWDAAIEEVASTISYNVAPRILTVFEAINGVKGWTHTKAIHMGTSSGFDPDKPHGAKGKHYQFDEHHDEHGEVFYTPKEKLQTEIDRLIDNYSKGICGNMLSVMNLKDERLPLEKVEQGKTRGFYGCTTAHLIVMRMYFGAFLENVACSKWENGCAVGINPHSTDWAGIAMPPGKYFKEAACMDGDAKHYGESHQPFAIMAYLRVVMDHYANYQSWIEKGIYETTFDDAVRLGALSDESITKHILIMDDIVTIMIGILSGGADTFVLQSIIGQITHKYCILNASREEKIRLLVHETRHFDPTYVAEEGLEHASAPGLYNEIRARDLRRILRLWTAGDDFFMKQMAELVWYTFPVMQEQMRRIGYTYTPADKSERKYINSKEEEITFLKRRIVRREGLTFAPMDFDDILEVLSWKSTRISAKEALEANCDWALREIFHHGKAHFNEWKQKLNDFLRSKACTPVLLSYEELLSDFLEDGEYMAVVAAEREEIAAQAQFLCYQKGYEVHEDAKELPGFKELGFLGECALRQEEIPCAQMTYEDLRNVSSERLHLLDAMPYVGLKWDAERQKFYVESQAQGEDWSIGYHDDLSVCSSDDLSEFEMDDDDGQGPWAQGLIDTLPVFREPSKEPLIFHQLPTIPRGLESDTETEIEEAELCDIDGATGLPLMNAEDWRTVEDPPHMFVRDFYRARRAKGRSVWENSGTNRQRARVHKHFTAYFKHGPTGMKYHVTFADKFSTTDTQQGLFLAMDTLNMEAYRRSFLSIPRQRGGVRIGPRVSTFDPPTEIRGTPWAQAERVCKPLVFLQMSQIAFADLFLSVPRKKYIGVFYAQSGEVPQEENQENVGGINEVQELTRTQDLVGKEEGGVRSKLQPYFVGTDPFADQGLSKVMSHKYRIANFNWVGTQVTNDLLLELNFPYALLNVAPNLVEKLNRMHFMRASTQIELRVNGTQFHYGKLLFGWFPYYSDASNTWKHRNIWTLSSCNAGTLSANTAKTVGIKIPYVSPKPYWDHTLNTNKGYFGTLVIRVLNPLSLSGSASTPTVSVSVFANFEDVELAGPTLHAQMQQEQRLPYAQMQREQQVRSKEGMLTTGLKAVSGISSVVSSLPLPMPARIGAAVLGGVSGMASRVTKAFGLDKPISLAASQPVQLSLTNGLAAARGMEAISDLSMDPENKISNVPADYGREVVETNLIHLVTKPGLIDVFTFDSSDAVGDVIKTYHVTPMTARTYQDTMDDFYQTVFTPVAAVAYNYRYWRGTMKYRIELSCSKFLSGRIRVSWHPTFSEIPGDFSANDGDFISAIVDFTGDTAFNFSVPFLQDVLYRKCIDTWAKPSDGENGALAISIVNPVVEGATAGDSIVYVNVYVAGEMDMDFQEPIQRIEVAPGGRTWDTLGNLATTVVAQGEEEESNILDVIFEKPFPSIVPATGLSVQKIVSGEENRSVLELMHRYTQIGQASFTNATWTLIQEGSITLDNPINLFRLWFLFRRGSRNYKLIRGPSTTLVPEGNVFVINGQIEAGSGIEPSLLTSPFCRNGTVVENLHYKPSVEWKTPWYSDNAFLVNAFTGMASDTDKFGCYVYWENTGANVALPYRLFYSIGDDYSFGWACGPPILKYAF